MPDHEISQRHAFAAEAGTISYIDRGEGPPVVFVHGNPSSAAHFEPVIAQLGGRFRTIAIDHLGFGQSDKPPSWDYRPEQHAANLSALLDSLDLTNVTLVAEDWGGPIGLSWCLDNPDRVDRLVLTNTWCWPVNRSLYYQFFSRFMGGPIGRHLIRNHNVFATQVVKRAWGTRTPLTSELHRSFTDVHDKPEERKAMWVFPGCIIGSTSWLDELWQRRAVLHEADLTLVWGMQDIAFRPDVLADWIEEFPDATVIKLDDVGHFPALEATNVLAAAIADG